ncbi:hypothetical protein [Phaffia rhodozyma]|uniref:Uncharacterized protein n=1 Tax=Phaffia rhodozyma TaxID=264483 RepID=A0A0F7SSI5_PHARH|nr:hypothetical protein [Phaffia rhodozyma]
MNTPIAPPASDVSTKTGTVKILSPALKETESVTSSTPVVPKKKLTREEQEKIKKEEALARKKALDDRLKNRSKRRPAPTDGDSSELPKPAKKAKELTAYEKEVLEISKRSGLSDSGAGMRSLVK